MEIAPGAEIHGLSLYLRKENALIFGDLHLGYEEELLAHGFMVPRFQYKRIVEHLRRVFSEVDASTVVIDGDLKHEFGRISQQEWREVTGFLDFLSEKTEKIVLVKGNHDTIMGPIAERKEITSAPSFFFEGSGVYVTHGHIVPKDLMLDKAKTVIIAHDHPAVALRDAARSEKVKCFLKGSWRNKTLIQLPSLSFVTEGTDAASERPLSPFMRQARGVEAYCVEDFEALYFGKLEDLP
jgi:hypothetical protein